MIRICQWFEEECDHEPHYQLHLHHLLLYTAPYQSARDYIWSWTEWGILTSVDLNESINQQASTPLSDWCQESLHGKGSQAADNHLYSEGSDWSLYIYTEHSTDVIAARATAEGQQYITETAESANT